MVNITDPTSPVQTGTYQGYLDGSLFITMPAITEADALANCKKNASSNPNKTTKCMWNNREIYKRDGVTSAENDTGTYWGYLNGGLFVEIRNITEADALANCRTNDKANPKASVLCIWKDKEIYRRAAPTSDTPSAEKGIYQGYLNGALFITTKDITQADALANCKRKANDNLEKTVKCTWNGTNIYQREANTSKKPTCTLKANPSIIPSGGSTTLTWVTTYADWVKLSDGKTDFDVVAKDSSRVFTNIKKDTTYTLRVQGKERIECAETVRVRKTSSMEEAQTQNLASALSALEAALQALVVQFSAER